MSKVPFSWMWGDPADSVDRIRALRKDAEAYEKKRMEQLRIKKSRRIRKLVKLAMAGKLKDKK